MKLATRLILVAVVVAAAFAYSAYRKSDQSNEVRQSAYARYADLGEARRVRQAVDRYHDECFDACYRSGGRRRAASFDESRYFQMMDERVMRSDLIEPVGHR